jgi:hypothetical protein
LNVIKYLANELQIPIVAIGTKDAFRAIPRTLNWPTGSSRTYCPAGGTGRTSDDCWPASSIPAAQKTLVLENDELSLKILALSEGALGEISTCSAWLLFKPSAAGKSTFQSIAGKLEWQAPSQRKAQINRLA